MEEEQSFIKFSPSQSSLHSPDPPEDREAKLDGREAQLCEWECKLKKEQADLLEKEYQLEKEKADLLEREFQLEEEKSELSKRECQLEKRETDLKKMEENFKQTPMGKIEEEDDLDICPRTPVKCHPRQSIGQWSAERAKKDMTVRKLVKNLERK